MAAYTLICARRNGAPIARQALAAAEDTVTVSAKGMRKNGARIQMVSTTAGLLFSDTQGVVPAGGFPVIAGQALTLWFPDGAVFYVAGTGAGFIDYLVVEE